MQLTTLFSVASAIAATASAEYGAKNDRSAVTENESCDLSRPHARVINRCDYDVYLWSVYQGLGCPETGMVTLKTGEVYAENYVDSSKTKTATSAGVGVSIKISKTQECKGNDITQLEYFINSPSTEDDGGYKKRDQNYNFNYLDVSYVDCQGMDCPARKDGYYLVAGNQTGGAKASADNTWCPILSCTDADSCDKMSYVLPDDVQTKTCYTSSSMDFYMCGGEAPDGDYDSAPKPESSAEYSAPSYASSTKLAEYPTSESTPAASSSSTEEVAYSADIEIAAAAITPTPQKQDEYGNDKLTKTKVVYVTAYEYVNEKRHAHAHDHARRHAAFHA